MKKYNFTYKFEELSTELSNTVAHINLTIARTKDLNELLETKGEAFQDLIAANNNAITQYGLQIKELEDQKAKVDYVVKLSRENNRVAEGIGRALVALRVFKLDEEVENNEQVEESNETAVN